MKTNAKQVPKNKVSEDVKLKEKNVPENIHNQIISVEEFYDLGLNSSSFLISCLSGIENLNKNVTPKKINSLIVYLNNHLDNFNSFAFLFKKINWNIDAFSTLIKSISTEGLNPDGPSPLEDLSIIKRFLFKLNNLCNQGNVLVSEIAGVINAISNCLKEIASQKAGNTESKDVIKYFSSFVNPPEVNETFIIDFLKIHDNIRYIETTAIHIIDLVKILDEMVLKLSSYKNGGASKIMGACKQAKKMIKTMKSGSNQIKNKLEKSNDFSKALVANLNQGA